MNFFRRAGASLLKILRMPADADPAAGVGQAQVYAKNVDGVTRVFARVSDGTVYQLSPPQYLDAINPNYGDGFDGALDWDGVNPVAGVAPVAGNYTLVRDIAATSAIHRSGVSINTGGYRILCQNEWLAEDATCIIQRNGGAGGSAVATVPGNPAGALAGGTLPPGIDGRIGATASSIGAAGVNSAVCPRQLSAAGSTLGGTGGAIGGTGGTGPDGAKGRGGGGGGGGGSATIAGRAGGTSGIVTLAISSVGDISNVDQANKGRQINSGTLFTMGVSGGGGGGGDNTGGAALAGAGGASGSTGGWIFFAARIITGPLSLQARGGAGGNGSAAGAGGTRGGGGGGGGAPGGIIIVVSGTPPGTAGGWTSNVLGGAGGLGGGNGGGTGGAGGPGGTGGEGHMGYFPG